jgi:hypothetical protein
MKLITVFSLLLSFDVAADTIITFSGKDGDGDRCSFAYNKMTAEAELMLAGFSFPPVFMPYREDYLGLYPRVFVGEVPHSEFTLIAESDSGNNAHEVLEELNLITVREAHDADHAHVTFCYDLRQD